MKITILITTYKRVDSLKKLVFQLDRFYHKYSGKNKYQILICNSDKNFPVKLPKIKAPLILLENDGQGFDMNLLNGLKSLDSDYVYLMGDDDVFGENPFKIIDEAFGLFKKDCYLFNHLNKSNSQAAYQPKQIRKKKYLLPLPRYCGLMYSVKFLKKLSLLDFDKTLHLYAAPFIYAATRKSMKFIDKPIVIFNDIPKSDGAWVNQERILNGLEVFRRNCEKILEKKMFAELSRDFFENYFKQDSNVFHNESNGLPYLITIDQLA